MKKPSETTFLDHFLVIVSCATSLFALGQSLGKPLLAQFLSVGSIVSLLAGYFVSRAVKDKKAANADSYLWSFFVVASALGTQPLNRLLPEEGVPFAIFAGAWLSWMILFCGFVSWRDQTLLFLNLPCLSLFALVGTFDSYPPATVLFFLFLVCSSLLYARIHRRAMVRRAQLAGVDDPVLLERDSWRWMAGPEWAFASAAVIVLVSLLGAPLLRMSVQQVSGAVKVSLPSAPSAAAAASNQDNAEMPVGRGRIDSDPTPLFKVKVSNDVYLRTGFYVFYNKAGWSRLRSTDVQSVLSSGPIVVTPPDDGSPTLATGWLKGAPLEPFPDPEPARLTVLAAFRRVPAIGTPGSVAQIQDSAPAGYTFSLSGLALRRTELQTGQSVDVTYLRPKAAAEPGSARMPADLRPIESYFLDDRRIPSSVVSFALAATANAGSDYDKAERIKAAIASAAKYSLKSPPVPSGSDPSEHFLFSSRVGYCDLFATSMVVCARAVGLPARYTVGYVVQDMKKDEQGFYTVRQKDAHAWAEVYFEGRGWVPFDPTEGAIAADDDESNTGNDGGTFWRNVVFVVALASTIGIVVLLLPQIKAFVAARTVAAGKSEVAPLQREFDRTVRSKTGVNRRFSMTVKEYADIAAPRFETGHEELKAVVAALDKAAFGPAAMTVDERETIKRLLKDLRSAKSTKGGR
ncbi:MAG: hypothetical protein JST30_16705 [Armatimonadetes bacterium]|nr:hypothetical protein [Armatimonadota bacterium]